MTKRIGPLALLALLFPGAVRAGIDTIYIIPLSHTDIGFTAPPSVVSAKMAAAADEAIEAARKDPAYVWCFETFWQLDQWLARHEDQGPVLDLLRSGRFGLSAAYGNPHSSLMSAWALDWHFRLPVEWGKRHGLTLDWAVIDDVPGHPIDFPTFLVRNGVKYLALGVNQSLSKPLPDEVSNTPFWWEAPDGSRVLTWICADAYTGAYTKYGVDPGTARFFAPKDFPEAQPLEVMRHGVGQMLEEYRKRDYRFDSVLAIHGFDNWGSAASKRLPDAVKTWNESIARSGAGASQPRLDVATPGEFFHHVEEKYGATLPVRRGGFGGQWEPVRTSTPTAIRRARAEEERLRARETPDAASVARLLVHWEHSFGMGGPWPKLLTRDEAVQHNREQLELIAPWPLAEPSWSDGEPVELPPRVEGDAFETNGLYVSAVSGGKLRRVPLSAEAWPLRRAVKLADGTLRLRHRIDRRKLPDPAHVVWAWKLSDVESKARVVEKTALGKATIPDDCLAGYDPGPWIAPEAFWLGGTEIRPHGVFVFERSAEHPGWLFGRVLDQGLAAVFKDGSKGKLSLEEAYPGEEPIFEFAIDVKR
jgi:hypothetical protein